MRNWFSSLTFLATLMLVAGDGWAAPNYGEPGMRKGQRGMGQGGGLGGGRGAQAGQIRCGTTGCFEIPRGCFGEMRRVGTGSSVVMHCNDHRPRGNNLH